MSSMLHETCEVDCPESTSSGGGARATQTPKYVEKVPFFIGVGPSCSLLLGVSVGLKVVVSVSKP